MRTRINAKCTWLAGLVAVLAVRAALAQGTNEPRLVCDAPAYDFGAVFNSTNVHHTFILKNEGNAPLVIDRVHAGCSCTTFEVNDKVVPPGGATRVTLVLSMKGWIGQKRFVSYVHSNDPQHRFLALECAASGLAEVELDPRILVFEPGATQAQWVAIMNRSDAPLHVLKAETVPPVFAVSVETNLDGQLYRIGVRPVTNPATIVRGQLRLATDHPRSSQLTLPLFMHASPSPGQ